MIIQANAKKIIKKAKVRQLFSTLFAVLSNLYRDRVGFGVWGYSMEAGPNTLSSQGSGFGVTR